MLTRNCETTTTNLFHENDFNVRVTVFDSDPKSFTPKAYKAAWIETIRDSIGGSILHSNQHLTFTVEKEALGGSYCFSGTTLTLFNILRGPFCPNPESIRIDICNSNQKKHSWIFLVTQPVEIKPDNKNPYLLTEDMTPRTRNMLKIFDQKYAPFSPYSGIRQMYFLTIGIHNRKQSWLTMIEEGLKDAGYFDFPNLAIHMECADDHFSTAATKLSSEFMSYLSNNFNVPPYILRVTKKLSSLLKPGEPEYIYFVIQDKFD